jgi:hypothetical protein
MEFFFFFFFYIGGACSFDLKYVTLIAECVFANCSGASGGGALNFFGYEDYISTPINFSHLFFIGCGTSTTHFGLDILLRGSQYQIFGGNYATRDIFYLCRSQSSSDNVDKLILRGGDEVDDKSCLLHPFLLSNVLYVGAVSTSGYEVTDRPYCGSESVRCRSVTFGDTTIDPSRDYVIKICEGAYKEWKLTSRSNRRRELKGSSNENTIIIVIEDSGYPHPLFYVSADTSNSTLSLSKITFTMSVSHSHSLVLIESSDCVLIMEDLKISCVEGITLESNLIKTKKNSFITKCKFYEILLKCNEDDRDDNNRQLEYS